ncbi:hypothetical protein QJQ45_019727, partial [Haematococcus lacustris]
PKPRPLKRVVQQSICDELVSNESNRRALTDIVGVWAIGGDDASESASEHPSHARPSKMRERASLTRSSLFSSSSHGCLPVIVELTRVAAVALRLIFHDCGTFQSSAADGGANASIRFELDRPENGGLKRGWRLIEAVGAAAAAPAPAPRPGPLLPGCWCVAALQVAKGLSGTAAAGVSQADLVALCGARAVAVCGGPQVQVRLGRLDASEPDPEGRLPGEQLTSQQLKDVFSAKGFSSREFLALCGAHTLGSKGFGDPTTFDNVYFKELLRKPWLDTKDSMAAMIGLPSDHVLPDDPELLPMIQARAIHCPHAPLSLLPLKLVPSVVAMMQMVAWRWRVLVQAYADDQALFFNDFQLAFQKLSELGTGWDA